MTRVIQLLLLVSLVLAGPSVLPVAAADNAITLENQQPGSDGWQLSNTANDLTRQIKGYASATSVNKGDSITFRVSVNPAQNFTMDVYRMGWYQGLGGRLMQHIGPLSGLKQAACPVEAGTGRIECNWPDSYTLVVPTTWTSGVYLVNLTNAQGYQNYITFVVRDDASTADILYQASFTTYQAYNGFPDDGTTGKSLYEYNSFGAKTVAGTTRAVKVSFDRPYADDGNGQFLNFEVYFVQWMERAGYDVTYSTDLDTHLQSARLLNHKAFLSVGHDEYWSKAMYDGVEHARDAGIHLGFFGANEVYWQVRFEASPLTGVPDRVMVGYKDASIDPVQGPTTTVLWRDPFLNRAEQRLVGVQYLGTLSPSAFVAKNTSHWVYDGTGMVDGDSIPAIEGDEIDTQDPTAPLPLSILGTYTQLSRSPVNTSNGSGFANTTIYQAPSGAWVFGAASITWSEGLGRPGVVDARIQQITANVLNRFVGSMTPRVVVAAAASPNPVTTGTTTTLSVLGADDGGEANLTYTWTTTGTPPGPVTFSANGTNAAKTVTATFTTAGTYALRVTIRDADSLTIISDVSVGVSMGQGPTCPCSIWTPTTPVGAMDSQTGGLELGVKFSADLNGFITGVSFYKYLQNTGTHIGNLWTANGTLLGTATFTNESASGWQQATFATPVAVTANTTYVASYHTNTGHYAATGAGLLTAVDTPPLHALSNASSGGNGVYLVTAASAFPNSTSDSTNYWVDVVFNTAAAGNTAPTVATAAVATPNLVSSTTTTLSVLGADDGGEPNLTYTWATIGTPPAPVTFSGNSTNAAKNMLATFGKAGNYSFQVTIRDLGNLTATSSVSVTVAQTPTGIAVTPGSAAVNIGTTQPFTATAVDQFAVALASQPAVGWTVNGGGSINASGLFTAGATPGGPFTVTASTGSLNGIASVTVTTAASVALMQQATATFGAASSVVVNLAAAPQASDALVLFAANSNVDVTAVSGGGVSWVQAARSSSHVATSVWYGLNSSGVGTAITVTFTNATGSGGVNVSEFSGVATANALDGAPAPTTGTATSVTTPTVATATANTLLVAAAGDTSTGATTGPTNAFSALTAAANVNKIIPAYRIVASVGSYSTGWTAPSGGWDAAVVALKASTVSGPQVPPTVATAAAASPNPVTGSTTALSVLGADDGGEPSLNYTWTTTGTPPAPVTFSANGTNAAKNAVATFGKAGSYTLQVAIRDQGGLTVTSSVSVTVAQTLTSIAVSPASASVNVGATKQFTATAADQFGTALASQPSVSWVVNGGGSMSATGLFTAGAAAGGPFTVTASSSGVSGNASVTVTITNVAPTVATAAAASPNPVTGSTTALSVLGADDGGEPSLNYTWTTTGTPPAPVTFSPNGTNAAKNAVATFGKAGSYTLQVTITDQGGLTVTSSVSVTVTQTLKSIAVSPASASVNAGATKQFTATAADQFGTALGSQPSVLWAVSGGGSISATGLFTAGAAAGGPFTVTASSSGVSGNASITVTITNVAPTVAQPAAGTPNPVTGTTTTLSALGADDGGEANLTYTWATTGTPPAAVTFSANGTNAAKSVVASFTKKGTYNFRVTIRDAGALSVTSNVSVTVSQTLTSITVSPVNPKVARGATKQFTASGKDQFAKAMAPQPSVVWSVSGGGTISATGLFTAGSTVGGPFTVSASSNGVIGTANVTVN